MSAWSDLAALGVVVRPLVVSPPIIGRGDAFGSTFSRTVSDLARELRALDARSVVLELDLPDRMIRLDGLPRADARPGVPAVAVSFDSRHGRLRYATGEFSTWQANLRAIALGLEALRKVDRYGIARAGEQYTGYRELPASTDPADSIYTREQAEMFLARWRDGSATLGQAARRALRETHPDHGGDPDEFRTVVRAREVLGV